MSWPWISRRLHQRILEITRSHARELAEAQLVMERRKLDDKFDEVNKLILKLSSISSTDASDVICFNVAVTKRLLSEMRRSSRKDDLFMDVARRVVHELNTMLL